MTMRLPRLLGPLVAALALSACTGTETGNPPFTAGAGFHGYEPVGLAPDPAVDEAFWVVGRLGFVPDGECGAPGEPAPAFEGRAVVDLAGEAGQAVTLEIHEGDYCGAQLVLALGEAPLPAGPAELEGASIVVGGLARGGDPVRLVSSLEAVVDLAGADGPFRLSPDEPPLVIAIDWTLAFAGVSLATADRTGGTVLIDATHNTGLLETFERNLPGAITLRRDIDADGDLDEEELRAPPLATGT